MKRLHIHLSVDDLEENIRFYSGIFASAPTVRKDDYAKWMLEDPRVNFAISTRAQGHGINHLGIQAESAEELTEIHQRVQQAGLISRAEPAANCCYAHSDKHWLQDPQGVVWEAFHTLAEVPVYGGSRFSPENQHAAGNTNTPCCPTKQPS